MLKVNELFSGIGAFRKALERLNIPHEIVGISEIDKYAIKSYEAMYGETRNYGDISIVDKLDYAELWTYGFPCQDISLAGQQKGIVKGETRSGLLYEVQRLLSTSAQNNELPKYLILENVKNLVGKKFKADFDSWLEWLNELGYNNYWQVINAKDCGIPQNRERVFVVSIRKDVDNGTFKFAEKIPLELRLKDMLEEVVDEKFYLSDKAVAGFNRHAERHADKGNGFGWNPTDGNVVANTLLASANCRPSDNFIKEPEMKQVGQIYGTEKESNSQVGRIYDVEGISPTMDSCSGGNRMPKVLIREATKKGYAEAVEGDSINLEQPNSKTRRGRVGHGVAQTLTTSPQQGVVVGNRWIDEVGEFVCSVCGKPSEYVSKFCPECGARMMSEDTEGGVENEQ